MAINVNTVYTTVLSILNKEQRGYLTPDEFNKLSIQVQLETFEKFFEDYNQFLRMPKTDVEFASRMDHTMEEFQVFEKTLNASQASAEGEYTQPTNLHRFGTASYNKGINSPTIEIVSSRDYKQQILSPLTQPTTNFPIAKYKEDKITVFPPVTSFNPPLVPAVSDITFNYIRKPVDVRWGYYLGSLGQYIYDSRPFSTSTLIIGSTLALSTPPSGTQATAGLYNSISTTLSNSNPGPLVDIVVQGTGTTTLTTSNTTITISPLENGTGYITGVNLVIAASSFGSLNNAISTVDISSQNLMSTSNTTQGSINYEISESQQTETILGVLKYAGIIIKDTQVIQAASGMQQIEETNSKK